MYCTSNKEGRFSSIVKQKLSIWIVLSKLFENVKNKPFVIDKTGLINHVIILYRMIYHQLNLQRWILWAGNVIILLLIYQSYSAINNYSILGFLCHVLLFCTSRPESVKGSLLRCGVWRNALWSLITQLLRKGNGIFHTLAEHWGIMSPPFAYDWHTVPAKFGKLLPWAKWRCTLTCLQTRP